MSCFSDLWSFFCGPPPVSPQLFLRQGTKLDTIFQVWPCRLWTEWDNDIYLCGWWLLMPPSSCWLFLCMAGLCSFTSSSMSTRVCRTLFTELMPSWADPSPHALLAYFFPGARPYKCIPIPGSVQSQFGRSLEAPGPWQRAWNWIIFRDPFCFKDPY